MTEEDARGLEHAWRYFALHAEQRTTVFNFYVASAGLSLSGLAWTLAGDMGRWPLGVAAGFGATILSLIFWRLDQRASDLVKTAERAIVAFEASSTDQRLAVFTADAASPKNVGWFVIGSPWTFGRAFRLLFLAVSIIGLAGAALVTVLGLASERLPRTKQPSQKSAASIAAVPKVKRSEATTTAGSNRATAGGAGNATVQETIGRP